MGGPDSSKVALVECRDLWFAKPLRERNDAGIDDAERKIDVASLQLAASGKVSACWRLGAVHPRQQIVEKDKPSLRWEPAATPIVELSEDERRNDQILVGFGQEPGAAAVIGIRRVERGKQRTGVADECHVSSALRQSARL